LWNECNQNYLVEEEREVVENLQILFMAADKALITLNGILLKENHKALAKFIKEDLYQIAEPVINKISELFQMQVRIIRNMHEHEQKRCKLILNIGMASIVTSINLCVIVVLQWRRLQALLDSL
jgi:hypothetical protein